MSIRWTFSNGFFATERRVEFKQLAIVATDSL